VGNNTGSITHNTGGPNAALWEKPKPLIDMVHGTGRKVARARAGGGGGVGLGLRWIEYERRESP